MGEAREIGRLIEDSSSVSRTSIQEKEVRVSGKSGDDLRAVIGW